MIHEPLRLHGTLQHTALVLRALFLRWPAFIAYAGCVSIGLWLSAMRDSFLPALLLSCGMLLALHVLHRFLKECLENDALPPRGKHPAELLSMDMMRALRDTPLVSGADLLRAATMTQRGRRILLELGITGEELLSSCLEDADAQIDVCSFLNTAAQQLTEWGETRVDGHRILHMLCTSLDCCRRYVQAADLSEDDLNDIMRWEQYRQRMHNAHTPWSPEAINHRAGLGRSWVAGYTSALDQITTDISVPTRQSGMHDIVIHKDNMEQVMRTLERGKQKNVLITGDPGTGKRTLITNLAAALRAKERAMNRSYSRVLLLKVETLLSGLSHPDTFFLRALEDAQRAGHFVLVIQALAPLLRSEHENVRTVLLKCLESKNINVIGIMDNRDYHALVRTNPTLEQHFEHIDMTDVSDEETMAVLMTHAVSQRHRSPHVPYKTLKCIIALSRRYLGASGGMPGSAVDVLDDALAMAREQKVTAVNEVMVRSVISRKGKVNVMQVTDNERTRLLHLEDSMRKKIIGQDPAIQAVCNALKRARMDLTERKRPIGTFLFLGPTGVGKTQTAKVLAAEYFGSSESLIRLDMNEFSHPDSILGLIGAPDTGDGMLSRKVHDTPFAVILLDEIEKAHAGVLNVFLQILDEGFLRDAVGRKTDFRNTIIIATSNAGALFIRDFAREHPDADRMALKEPLIDSIIRAQTFSPEFLNRFDASVLFYPLSRNDARLVAQLMVDEMVLELQSSRGITLRIAPSVMDRLIAQGYSMEFGARELRRTITDTVETYLADYVLRHDVKRGDVIEMT